jgi:hypothetical protein
MSYENPCVPVILGCNSSIVNPSMVGVVQPTVFHSLLKIGLIISSELSDPVTAKEYMIGPIKEKV